METVSINKQDIVVTDEDIKKYLEEVVKARIKVNRFKDTLLESFRKIEETDNRVVDMVMNAVVYADVRKLGGDILIPNNDGITLRQGLMGYIWRARLWVTRLAQSNEIKIYNSLEPIVDFPEIEASRNAIEAAQPIEDSESEDSKILSPYEQVVEQLKNIDTDDKMKFRFASKEND